MTITYHSGLPETHPTGAARQLLEEFNRTNTQKITVDLTEGQAATTETKAKTLAAPAPPQTSSTWPTSPSPSSWWGA